MATIFDQEVLNSFKCEAIRRFPLGAWARRVCRLVRTGFAIDLPPDVEFNERVSCARHNGRFDRGLQFSTEPQSGTGERNDMLPKA